MATFSPAQPGSYMFYPPFPDSNEDSSQAQASSALSGQQHLSNAGPPVTFPPHAPYGPPLSQEQVSLLQHGIRPNSAQNGGPQPHATFGSPVSNQALAASAGVRPLSAQPNSSAVRAQKQKKSLNGSTGPRGIESTQNRNDAANSSGDSDVEGDGDVEGGADEEEGGAGDGNAPPEGFYYLAPPPPHEYDTLEDTIQAMHDWNKDHGFDVSKQKPMKNKAGDYYKYLYRCTRHGKLDNNRKLTEDTRKRKRKSGKTGCPMGLYIRAVDPSNASGKWRISYQQNNRSKFHNHEGALAQDLTGHRRRHRTEEMIDLIRQQRAVGMDATQTLAYIKERMPGALVTKQDILNYRRADPGPTSDSTNYLDKPYILCLSFLQDFESDLNYGQALLMKLRTKLPVSVCTKAEHYAKHFDKNPPKVVIVSDPALTYPSYRLQLARLVTYNQDGGTVVFMGHFCNTPREYINSMFLHHYNLEWEASGDLSSQGTYRLNDKLEAGGTGGRYTVVARNFAPGTDVKGIETLVSLSPNASLVSCRLYSQHPIVVAELIFSTQEGAEEVINTFSGKAVNLGRVSTAEGKELQFSLRTPAPMGTSDLAPQCFLKANALAKVQLEHTVYQYVYPDMFGNWSSQLPSQNLQGAASTYAKIGKGHMGYVGQIDYDENYLRLVAAMCHF